MKTRRLMFAAAVGCSATLLAQSGFPPFDVTRTHRISDQEARSSVQVEATFGTAPAPANAYTPGLPVWTYTVTAAQDGKTYSGQMLGQNPAISQGTMAIPVVLVPVVFNIFQGGAMYTFDPTAGDAGCIGSGNTALRLMAASPLFENANFSFNGTPIGDTQYEDAFLRGEFWTLAQKTNYRLRLLASTGAPLTLTIIAGAQGNAAATVYSAGTQCGSTTNGVNPPGALAVVNINTVDAILKAYMHVNGLKPYDFPFFVTYNSVLSQGAANNLNNCCVLGYHNALSSGQTYGLAEFEGRNQTIFSGVSDVSAASHEVGEWVNDPTTSNPTPAWGNVGQDTGGGCQSNFEVGDPLTGTLMPEVSLNGFSYHLQEMAYFSWFYGGPSEGAGNVYSSNATFRGAAKLCPPGGTN